MLARHADEDDADSGDDEDTFWDTSATTRASKGDNGPKGDDDGSDDEFWDMSGVSARGCDQLSFGT